MLTTERLLLRPLTTGDLDAFVEMYADPRVNRFIGAFSPERALNQIQLFEQQWAERGHGVCAVELRSTGEFIGRCGLNYRDVFDEIELGWTLTAAHWGHGYATEAARACRDWGFTTLKADYFTAMIHPGNTASEHVATRLGFTPRRQDTFRDREVTVWAVDRPAGQF